MTTKSHKRDKPKAVKVSVDFPPSMVKAIDDAAEKHGLNRSNAIRFFIAKAITKKQ